MYSYSIRENQQTTKFYKQAVGENQLALYSTPNRHFIYAQVIKKN